MPKTSKQFIALEWIDGVTLEEFLKTEGPQTWDSFYERFGKPILSALTYAAERNIAHRDLSTGNVLVTVDQRVKIIDFGQAKLNNVGIGLTVMDWRTVPYCLPEEDTGTYTYTRDPYAFCAICVRAIAGKAIANHEELYEELDRIVLPGVVRDAVTRALSRVPDERFKTIIEFGSALCKTSALIDDGEERSIAIRLSPGLADKILLSNDQVESSRTAEEVVLAEMNDMVNVAPTQRTTVDGRIEIETSSYRLVAAPDSSTGDHLVIIKAVRKRFRLDVLFQSHRWVPRVRFTSTLPRSAGDRKLATDALTSLYSGLEAFLDEQDQENRGSVGGAVSEWGNLLEALRYIAKNSVPPIRYTNVEKDGSRLVATVENPDDAVEEQMRFIAVDRSWVFRGEVESIHGNTCVLMSTRPYFDIERIPGKGTLEIDWQQTKVALDRQARAVDKFKANENPSGRLRDLLTGVGTGPAEPAFGQVTSFFDEALDVSKKKSYRGLLQERT